MSDIDKKGNFVRPASGFRHWVKADKASEFTAEAGRYHLYVSYACPWAHRAIIMRSLKGLEDVVSLSAVDVRLDLKGWSFGHDGKHKIDPIYNAEYLSEIYFKADPEYNGNYTVPVLWDTHNSTIVNNESAEILRILNSEFNDFSDNHQDYYPKALQTEIDTINNLVYEAINNGVYKVGFAQTEAAYQESLDVLFNALDKIDADLQNKKYLLGEQLTEADIRLFTTLLRFDPVYYDLFRCNKQKISDYKNLSRYLNDLKSIPEIAATINVEEIVTHYYESPKLLAKINVSN